MKHFEYYPKVEYTGDLATNIMVRCRIREAVKNDLVLHYKYTIQDNQTAESVANAYYGSPDKVWAIYYANDIFHPIFDWPMSQNVFERYLIEKYGSIESISAVYNTDGTLNFNSIHKYVEHDLYTNMHYIVTKEEYLKRLGEIENYKKTQNDPTVRVPNPINPVTIYDYEKAVNDGKKSIVVVDKKHISAIVNDIRNIFDK